MKQSKTPLWKKSCLGSSLSFENIVEWLDEIGDNGDAYGYEDSSIEGYYNEYKDQFDELAAGAYTMWERLSEYDYCGGEYNEYCEIWDDMTVNLLGELYTVYGFNPAELDYFKLSGFEETLAMQEAEKRLMRLTKQQLIRNFRKVLMTLVMFFDLKAAHDCLTSIVEELDEKGALLERKNERINALYSDLTGKSGEAFDEEIAHLPPRMWVE
ncbi:hypothetical protein [Ruminococcus sp.]|uniref:hypothetical protein n=1 Tax=Ruminococcus sp. TaxID=41978 RepID=UPI0025D8803B|nr:hypothetical protein [Ruminococcus sp.]MBQ8965881.1 hypothetical protein [Ruminococcus sp.]